MSKRHVKAYPKEFREQVEKLALSSGRRPREIAEEFEISMDSVRLWVKLAKPDKCPRKRRCYTRMAERLGRSVWTVPEYARQGRVLPEDIRIGKRIAAMCRLLPDGTEPRLEKAGS